MTCPKCGREHTATARQVYERTVALPLGLNPMLLAPPPAPVDPATVAVPASRPPTGRKSIVLFVVGGLMAGSGLLELLVGSVAGDQTYQGGWEAGPLLRLVLGLCLVASGYWNHRSRRWPVAGPVEQHVHLHNRAVYTRRTQVWEHAQVCLDCPGVFFAAGALRPDFPASPLIELGQFPVMVATMADRAYAGAR
ncbi:hypothetical protein C7C46_29870 [Streptomyces tateyamensis]|uniref:Uncharacterized protein n=1 Tax=Streptomyces tateyamensis TaxID=565073 RepID=A0A2V4N0Z8_9ACTN|nr:hypothetical protein [Streptomyces tateyamensis]PYC67848.1 hypothetical protein C7C46_29870 [Streptomyces tateyamensis]